MRRLTPDRHAAPRQILRRVAPVDDDLVPRHREDVGGHAREIDHRVRAEIADARLDVQPAVRLNRHQTVVADRSGSVWADRDTDAADLRPVTLTGARLPLVPLEALGAAIERLLHEGARHVRALAVGPRRAVQRLAFRRIDPANRDLIEAELLRRLRD